MILFLLKFSGNSNANCLISRETETRGSLREGYSCSADRFHFCHSHLVINEANQAMRSLCIILLVKVETTKLEKNPDFFCCFLLFFVLN